VDASVVCGNRFWPTERTTTSGSVISEVERICEVFFHKFITLRTTVCRLTDMATGRVDTSSSSGKTRTLPFEDSQNVVSSMPGKII
jgi:hypothetical protein